MCEHTSVPIPPVLAELFSLASSAQVSASWSINADIFWCGPSADLSWLLCCVCLCLHRCRPHSAVCVYR